MPSRYEAVFSLKFFVDDEDVIGTPPVRDWCACCEQTRSSSDEEEDEEEVTDHLHVCGVCITGITKSRMEEHSPRCVACGEGVYFHPYEDSDMEKEYAEVEEEEDWDYESAICGCRS